jgi:hypothetical protein
MQPRYAIWQGVLIALQTTAWKIAALWLAALLLIALKLFDDAVFRRLLELQPEHGVLRGFIDWGRDYGRRAKPGFGLPLSRQYVMVSLLNTLRLSHPDPELEDPSGRQGSPLGNRGIVPAGQRPPAVSTSTRSAPGKRPIGT